jgi:hypothetical protein
LRIKRFQKLTWVFFKISCQHGIFPGGVQCHGNCMSRSTWSG